MLTDEQIEQWRKYLKESEEAFGEIHGQIDQLCAQAKAANRMEQALREIADSDGAQEWVRESAREALRGEAR